MAIGATWLHTWGMRWLAVLLIGLGLSASSALADQDDPRLDTLFERLQTTDDPQAAAQASAEIWEIWSSIPDDAAQELMRHGQQLIASGRPEKAIAVYDILVNTHPAWAEAWNKRATAHFMARNFEASVADIQETLSREPRHFGAWSGLGLIYAAQEKPSAALQAFEKAIEINPHFEGARANAEAMRERIEDGEPI